MVNFEGFGKESNEKLKKHLNNLIIIVELINTIVSELDKMFEKKNNQQIDKLLTNFKELKQYLKKLKLFFEDNKNYSIIQIQMLEHILSEAAKKVKNKEKDIFHILLKGLLTDTEQVIEKNNSSLSIVLNKSVTSRMSVRKSHKANNKLIYNQLSNNIQTDVLKLEAEEIYSSYSMSTFSMPNIFSLIFSHHMLEK